jgi:hypothetical protein
MAVQRDPEHRGDVIGGGTQDGRPQVRLIEISQRKLAQKIATFRSRPFSQAECDLAAHARRGVANQGRKLREPTG